MSTLEGAGLFLCALVVGAVACSRPPLLVAGPIELTPQVSIVRFVQPVSMSGPRWEMCFEFDLPRDSHEAASINVTLIDGSGTRYRLEDLELDRRGESVVCQSARLAAVDPAKASAVLSAVVLEAAELSAASTLRLRGVRGESQP